MKFSLTSLKISIAGARLSHLVQKDAIWDHGSMVEQVRTVVTLLKKSFHRGDPEIIKKCMTEAAFTTIKQQVELSKKENKNSPLGNSDLKEVCIINVAPGRNVRPDKFTAALKFMTEGDPGKEQQWLFVRQGDWWLLDEIKKTHALFLNLY